MTTLYGDTGRVTNGTLKTFSFSYPNLKEDNLDLNLGYGSFTSSLPTTQTPSVGCTYTLQSSDFPTITPSVPAKYTAYIYVSGINNSGGNATITVQPFKNGISQNGAVNTSLTTTNNYFNQTWYKFFDVVAGDVLNLQIWSNVANVSFDVCAMWILPTQPQMTKKNTMLTEFSYTPYSISAPSTPSTGGAIGLGTNTGLSFYVGGGLNFAFGSSSQTNFFHTPPNDYLYKIQNGDNVLSWTQTGQSTRQLMRSYTPATISFREVTL